MQTPRCRPPLDEDTLDAYPHGCRHPGHVTCDACCEATTPPLLVNRMTHRCKNINLPQTLFSGLSFLCTKSPPFGHKNNLLTRMHSSRMHTIRSSGRLSWGVSAPGGYVCSRGCVCSGGCLLRGVSALGGSAPGGLLVGGGIPACTEADTPLWTDRRL